MVTTSPRDDARTRRKMEEKVLMARICLKDNNNDVELTALDLDFFDQALELVRIEPLIRTVFAYTKGGRRRKNTTLNAQLELLLDNHIRNIKALEAERELQSTF